MNNLPAPSPPPHLRKKMKQSCFSGGMTSFEDHQSTAYEFEGTAVFNRLFTLQKFYKHKHIYQDILFYFVICQNSISKITLVEKFGTRSESL